MRGNAMQLKKKHKKSQQGLAIVEMTLILPLFLVLAFGVFEMYRLLLANNIIIGMSREGANLVARTSDTDQKIMDVISSTAAPLTMNKNGIMYVTVLVGGANKNKPLVLEQHRWVGSQYSGDSRVWSECKAWTTDTDSDSESDSCVVPSTLPILDHFNMVLDPGETVNVIEVLYEYENVLAYVIQDNLELYSRSLL
ncbi:TadE/TadG family type IV pilus assembly protein [Oceanisphaera profunda]|nr:TadE/TadG family type IV pilus assembly protein [Oceanisphaera profunda]